MLTAHNCWCNYGRGHFEEHIFEIIIILSIGDSADVV